MLTPIAKSSAYGLLALFLWGAHVSPPLDGAAAGIHWGMAEANHRSDHRDDRFDHRDDRREDFADDRHSDIRRAVRRTVRRANLRHEYYHGLPKGCLKVFVRGALHFHCGGIYYQPRLENNKNVYIIVNL